MQKNDLYVTSKLTDRIDDICKLFQETHWASWREASDVGAMLRNSIASVGLVDKDTDALVGFARAVGDGKFKAIVEDVVVAESLRKTGIGTVLVDLLLNHPLVSNVEEVELYCSPDLLKFYSIAGFKTVPDQLLMRTKGRTFSK